MCVRKSAPSLEAISDCNCEKCNSEHAGVSPGRRQSWCFSAFFYYAWDLPRVTTVVERDGFIQEQLNLIAFYYASTYRENMPKFNFLEKPMPPLDPAQSFLRSPLLGNKREKNA